MTVAGAALRLDAIQDLGERLAGRDDAFRLLFSGAPGAVAGDSAECSAAGLGTFSLFVAPVGAVEGGVARYEVVVDRSIPLPRNVPSAPAPASAAAPVAAAASVPARAPKKGVVRAMPKKKKLTRAQRRRRKAMLKKLARKR